MQVTVREKLWMPLENGGTAKGGETVTVSDEYYPKIAHMCESLKLEEKPTGKSKKTDG